MIRVQTADGYGNPAGYIEVEGSTFFVDENHLYVRDSQGGFGAIFAEGNWVHVLHVSDEQVTK